MVHSTRVITFFTPIFQYLQESLISRAILQIVEVAPQNQEILEYY